MGKPHNPDQYRQEKIDGVTVFVPYALPRVPLVVHLSTFMGFKRLVVDGWRHY
jgi:hypothetical protein